MAVHIKTQNYWAIHDAFILNNDRRVQGSKLEALNRLIQRKGEIVNLSDRKIKALDIGEGKFVALEIQHLKPNSFFPCKIRKYHLQKLSPN